MKKLKPQQILDRFQKARQVRQRKDKIWQELDMFDRGEQWEVKKMPPWIPRPVTNYVHLVKTMKRAALAVENPAGKLYPTSPESVYRTEVFQRVYEHELRQVKARKIYREVLETAKLLGTGIAHIFYDENVITGERNRMNDGQLKAEQIDPSSFYPDPTAFRLEDCRYVHINMRKSLEWIKQHPLFKGKIPADLEPRTVSPEERGEIYRRDYDSHQHASDGIIDFHIHFEKIPLPEGGFQFRVYYLAGEHEVHFVEDLRPRRYPFSILYDFPQRQDFWGKSTCEMVLENQKIVNKVESIISMIGILMQNPQKVVWKASGINPREVAKFGDAPGHTYESLVDPSRAVHWVNPPQIPQQLFNLAEQAKQNIRDITGLTEAYMGQTVGSLQTSGGVQSLIERSTMRDRDQMFDFEMFIEDFSRNLIAHIVEKYTETRYAYVLKDRFDPILAEDFIEYKGSDFDDLAFDFVINVSAKAPITRMRQSEELDSLLEKQGQYGFEPPVITPQEYVKSKEFVLGEQILQRMEQDEQQIDLQKNLQVARMMHEAMMNQVPEQEIMAMAQQMMQQLNQPESSGNVQQPNLQQLG